MPNSAIVSLTIIIAPSSATNPFIQMSFMRKSEANSTGSMSDWSCYPIEPGAIGVAISKGPFVMMMLENTDLQVIEVTFQRLKTSDSSH